jgi:hypothetical protein
MRGAITASSCGENCASVDIPAQPPAYVPPLRSCARLLANRSAQALLLRNASTTRVVRRSRIAWLALRPVEQLTNKEQTDLSLFCQEHVEVSPAIALARSFATMLRERTAEALEVWLTEAQASPLTELRTFASGVAHDQAAVTAALTRAESNGQVEGHITRGTRCACRQMYGRTKLPQKAATCLACGMICNRRGGMLLLCSGISPVNSSEGVPERGSSTTFVQLVARQ